MSRRRSFFESSNPVMNEKAFQQSAGTMVEGGQTMTVNGAVNKTLLLTSLLLLTTVYSYINPSPLLMWGGAIGGLIVVIISVFKPQYSNITAPIYAALEGLFVGAISAVYASLFDGIIFQAVTITMGILFMMLFLYKSGIIKVTKSFRTGVIMATGAHYGNWSSIFSVSRLICFRYVWYQSAIFARRRNDWYRDQFGNHRYRISKSFAGL